MACPWHFSPSEYKSITGTLVILKAPNHTIQMDVHQWRGQCAS